MQLRFFTSLAATLAVVCLGACGSRNAKAEEIQFVSTTAFADMQSRLEDVEYQLASFDGKGGKGDCGGKGGCGYCGTCTTPGVTTDLELLFLRPFGGDGGNFDTNNQYNAGVRLTGGYVREDGLGVQMRWFSYGIDTIDLEGHFDAYYVDLELTDKFQLGCWDGTLSGGVRYSEFDQRDATDGMYGWGPEVGVKMARNLRGNLFLVSSARYAMIFGKEQHDDQDDAFSATELQMGLEYRGDLGGTAQWFARTALEAQYWNAVADDDEEDLGLVGAAFSLGITR